ncbi:MAG: bifunctional oligoribonuclease/PAP phosphatase NrnA [Thermoanaerobaculia bacterium]
MIPETVLSRVASDRRFLITSHANPDGDAIGSELALARILRAAGMQAAIWNASPTPAVYRALPGSAEIHVGETPPLGFPGAFDCVVVLECPTLDRSGLAEPLAALPQVNIDHHLGNPDYGVAHWVDTSAAAVAVMVAELARALRFSIDATAADCLLLGLVSDTGGFRFSNASPAAFEAAAALVRDGARPEQVSQWLNESQPESAIRLLAELLATLTLHFHGRIASVHLDAAMFERAKADAGDSEGLVDAPRSIAGVEAVVLLRQVGGRQWKISLRSRGGVDVQSIAKRHGGGGHRNAAGCKAEGELTDLKAQFVRELEAAMEPMEPGA